MTELDHTTRFLFTDSAVRGEITQLNRSVSEVLSKHHYPSAIQPLLGQFMAAAAMLSDTLKFDGTLSLQVRGSGQVRTLMAECRDNRALRALAQYNDDFDDSGPILGEGQMAITIEPKQGHRYQGVVAINDTDLGLAQVLEGYFQQSEQIRTRIWLFADGHKAAGLMLQAMPQSASDSSLDIPDDDENWSRLMLLASTLKAEEIFGLDAQTVLHRLFHEETARFYPPRPLAFECTCSVGRSGNAIITLGAPEALALVAELGHIDIDCQFCHERYIFKADDVRQLFSASADDSLN
jgi:molecular chaperone Hsp33